MHSSLTRYGYIILTIHDGAFRVAVIMYITFNTYVTNNYVIEQLRWRHWKETKLIIFILVCHLTAV